MSRTPRRVALRLVLSATTAAAVLATAHASLTGGATAASGADAGLTTAFGVQAALSDGPTHVDPLPPGVSLDDPTHTRALYARAGLDRAELAAAYAGVAEGGDAQDAAATPPGPPSTHGLGAHVTPSCAGTGTDGKRVQPMYVREASTTSRYASVLPLLLNEVANVDDVIAVSAARTGGIRRVRWVHEGCTPVLPEVVVPAGALSSFGATTQALAALGYTDPNRKYLVFADANVLCGIGTLYLDTRPTSSNNNDTRTSYARVDANCWSGRTSIAAHELTHNLGGVLPGAPHRTANGHCFDESDLMCYDDGSGVTMQTVCADSRHGQLLDCGNDDYFSTAPAAGSWLAANWNTASSSFLDTTVSDSTLPPPTTTPPSSTQTAPEPVVRKATKVRGDWHGRHRRVTGVLRQAGDGTGVSGVVLALERRYAGEGWTTIARERTDQAGRVAERDRPRRAAYYRWVFPGSDAFAASRSSTVRAGR